MIVSGKVEGKVQGVMFRQTFIRGLLKRNLSGGATNLEDRNIVSFTIEGDEESVQSVIDSLAQIKPLNSWNAEVQKVSILDEIIPIEDHQVTTLNVDGFNWNPDVEFFF